MLSSPSVNSSLISKPEVTNQCFSYNFNLNTASIVEFNNTIKHIHIPIIVEKDWNKFNITEISKEAFKNSTIRTVHIPKDSYLLKIGFGAFNISLIAFISIPASVEEIDDEAFLECECLSKIIIPNDSHLKTIGKYALSLTKISEFTVPKHVTEIKEGTFDRCLDLTEIKFDEDSELKKICNNAFRYSSLNKINIPKSVVKLEDGCFNASHLHYVNVESGNPIYKNLIIKNCQYHSKLPISFKIANFIQTKQ